MPPRKSNASTTGPAEEPSDAKAPAARQSRGSVGIEDLTLPRSMIQRLAKGVLPPQTSITKDSLLALSKSATVFVNYIASAASEHAVGQGRKTIQASHVLSALKENEFEGLIARVEAEVQRFNELQTDKRNQYRQKVKADKDGVNGLDAAATSETVSGPDTNGHDVGSEGERPAKKLRTEDGGVNVDLDDVDGERDDEAQDGNVDVDEDDNADAEDQTMREEDEGSVVESEASDVEVQGEEEDEDEDPDRVDDGIQDEALDDHGDSD